MRAYELLFESYNSGTFVSLKLTADSSHLLATWMKENNVPDPVKIEDLHVTIIYDRNSEFPWEPEKYRINLDPKTYRLALFGTNNNILVLSFKNKLLSDKHHKAKKEHNIQWDFDEYIPHITLTKDLPTNFDLSELKIPTFSIQLHNETVRPNKVTEQLITEGGQFGAAYVGPMGTWLDVHGDETHAEVLYDFYGRKWADVLGGPPKQTRESEILWHNHAQENGWIRLVWQKKPTSNEMNISYIKPDKKAIEKVLSFIQSSRREFDVFRANDAEFDSFPKFAAHVRQAGYETTVSECAGVGTIQKSNTTVDVKPGEIQRQAKKFGWKVDKNGVPPTIGKIK